MYDFDKFLIWIWMYIVQAFWKSVLWYSHGIAIGTSAKNRDGELEGYSNIIIISDIKPVKMMAEMENS